MINEDLEQAVSDLRRDPGRTVRARVDGIEVDLRVVGSSRPPRPLGDFLASLGPWEGETCEELLRRLREAREAGGSSAPPEL